jgi:hypothetical protein
VKPVRGEPDGALEQVSASEAPGPEEPERRRALRARPRAVTAVWVLGVAAAFACYLQLARTRAVNSDGANNALQAWDMLHGNLLLRGWSLGDVSYYTTELPQYMLVEFLRGLNEDVVHVAAAMTYTLATLLAALLAKGRSTGREGLVRVLIAVGIMLAPQLASGVNILISSPDHIGTSVPVMVVWLILDHARPRWYVPVIAGAFLGWAEVADMLVLYIGVLPLALVCAVRVGQAVAVDRKPLASQWYDLALGATALLGAATGLLALYVIHARGGFYMPAPAAHVAQGMTLVRNVGIAAQGLLLLGGADFLGLRLTASTGFTILHVVGVFLAAWGTLLAARRFLRDRDRLTQLLVTGVGINLVIYVFSTRANVISQTREIAAVLPFSAVLAGRLLAPRLKAGKLAPLLLVVLLGYTVGLAREISQPPVAAQNQQLTSWLAARHLHTGLSGYWESSVVTLTSGDRVQIRTVPVSGGRLTRSKYEAKAQWYDPERNTANFVVLSPGGTRGYPGFTAEQAVLATFGKPARTYHVGIYTVLVWNGNLLRELTNR